MWDGCGALHNNNGRTLWGFLCEKLNWCISTWQGSRYQKDSRILICLCSDQRFSLLVSESSTQEDEFVQELKGQYTPSIGFSP